MQTTQNSFYLFIFRRAAAGLFCPCGPVAFGPPGLATPVFLHGTETAGRRHCPQCTPPAVCPAASSAQSQESPWSFPLPKLITSVSPPLPRSNRSNEGALRRRWLQSFWSFKSPSGLYNGIGGQFSPPNSHLPAPFDTSISFSRCHGSPLSLSHLHPSAALFCSKWASPPPPLHFPSVAERFRAPERPRGQAPVNCRHPSVLGSPWASVSCGPWLVDRVHAIFHWKNKSPTENPSQLYKEPLILL
jgi:hypothetical protein